MRLWLMLFALNASCSLLLDAGENRCQGSACQDASGLPDPGAITFEGSTRGRSEGESSTLSFTHFVNDSDQLLLVAACIQSSSATYSSVEFAGAQMQSFQPKSGLTAGDDVRLEIWYLQTPEVGGQDIVLTSSSSRQLLALAFNVSGVDPSDPLGEAVYDGGIDTETSLELSSETGQLVFSTICEYPNNDAGNLVFGPMQTEVLRVVHETGELLLGASTKPGMTESPVTLGAAISKGSGEPVPFAHIAVPLMPSGP